MLWLFYYLLSHIYYLICYRYLIMQYIITWGVRLHRWNFNFSNYFHVSVRVSSSFTFFLTLWTPTFNVIFNDTFSALVVCYLTLCIEYFKHLHLIKLYLDFSRLILVILKTFFIATICCSTDKLATN